jgi:hypothetical protein
MNGDVGATAFTGRTIGGAAVGIAGQPQCPNLSTRRRTKRRWRREGEEEENELVRSLFSAAAKGENIPPSPDMKMTHK